MAELHTFDWIGGLTAWRGQWEQLLDLLPDANPSMGPGWMDVAVRSHAVGQQARTYVLAENDAVAGVLPVLVSERTMYGTRARVLDAASNVASYHASILGLDGGLHILERVLDDALSSRWDMFRINNVPSDSSTLRAIRSIAASKGWHLQIMQGDRSPFLVIDKSWNDYLRDRSKKFRANITRYSRKLGEWGSDSMVWYGKGSETSSLLNSIMAVEELSWKKRDGVAIHDRPTELRYHELLLPYLSSSGMLMANVLQDAGRPIAYVLCATDGKWVGQLKTSFDARIGDAGACAFAESVKRAFACGASEYDFLGNADKHKLAWTERMRDHTDCVLYSRTPVGRWLYSVHAVRGKLKAVLGRAGITTGLQAG